MKKLSFGQLVARSAFYWCFVLLWMYLITQILPMPNFPLLFFVTAMTAGDFIVEASFNTRRPKE